MIETFVDIFKRRTNGVIHFAGLKAVGESTRIPLTYYDTEYCSTLSLLKVMKRQIVKIFIFSSHQQQYMGDPLLFQSVDFPTFS